MLSFFKHHWNRRDQFMARWTLVHFAYAIAIGAFLALGFVMWQMRADTSRVQDLRQMAEQVQTVSKAPPGTKNIGGPFSLINQDGKAVSDADYRGKLMLVYFGYTYCPDMCPTGLTSMAHAVDLLDDEADKVAPIFVTIDPARDTTDKLKYYVAGFHPKIDGLTGSDKQIAAAAAAYQVYYAKGEQVDEGEYVMDHSSLIYLMGTDGSFVTTFPEDADPEAIVKAIRDQLNKKKP